MALRAGGGVTVIRAFIHVQLAAWGAKFGKLKESRAEFTHPNLQTSSSLSTRPFGGIQGRCKLQKKVHKVNQRRPERSQQEGALRVAVGKEVQVDAEPF